MDHEVLELITQFLTDMRMGDVAEASQEYQQALKHEQEVHDRLVDSLNEEQKKLLEEFLEASSESVAVYEKLSYQQGMRDLFALFRSLV